MHIDVTVLCPMLEPPPPPTTVVDLEGVRGVHLTPSGPILFHFHGDFQEILCEIRQTNPLFSSPEPLGSQGELIGWP